MLLGGTESVTEACNLEEMLKKYVKRVVSAEIIFTVIISNFMQ
jgi:hypothetical protein